MYKKKENKWSLFLHFSALKTPQNVYSILFKF